MPSLRTPPAERDRRRPSFTALEPSLAATGRKILSHELFG